MNLFKRKTKEQKQQEEAQKSVQQLIPLKSLRDGKFLTLDNKLVQILRVNSINMELMGNLEANDLFERYEGFLSTLTYPTQQTIVSMPVDLKTYIDQQKQILANTTNPFKRMLLEDYIQYAKDIETSQDIMQRQRFVAFYIKPKNDTEDALFEAELELNERRDEIMTAVSELDLMAEEVTDLEIVRYFHTLFDYTGSQNRPIESTIVPQIIHGGKKDD
jgi:hypothetical protein